MKSFPKYYAIFLLILSSSCNQQNSLTQEEKKQKAQQLWVQHFNGDSKAVKPLLQGSPKAMQVLDQVIQLNPDHCEALREISVAYLKRGMPWEWKPYFDRAVECDPESWLAWRGYLYLFFYRDYKKAIADFDAGDALTPNFVDYVQGHNIHFWRGLAYLGLNDLVKAQEYFKKDIQHETEQFGDAIEPKSFLYLGITQFELNEYIEAEINFKKVLELTNQNSAEAHFYLSKIYLSTYKYDSSQQQINWAINDFKNGYRNSHNYVEQIHQIYIQDLENLRKEIEINNPK